MRLKIPTLLAAIFLLFGSPQLSASDGVLEINQACAINGGCFSGDSDGYPITIDGSAGNSYLLTSDLVVPDVDTHGILVGTAAIGIDLNGFTISRLGCDEVTLSGCFPFPPAGTGSGIIMQSGHHGISVKNGSIVGMGDRGVFLNGNNSEVKNMRIRWNRTDGIHGFFHSNVSGNSINNNGGDGIKTSIGAIISGNNVRASGGDGIEAGEGSIVTGNTSIANEGNGIRGVQLGLVIIGNTAQGNGGDGISTFGGSTVQNNAVRNNTGFGLNLSADAMYRGNVIDDNTAGTVNGGFNMGDNFCNTDDTCP